jgi:hypothetical protein
MLRQILKDSGQRWFNGNTLDHVREIFRNLGLKPPIIIRLKNTLVTISPFRRQQTTTASFYTLQFIIYCTTNDMQSDSLLWRPADSSRGVLPSLLGLKNLGPVGLLSHERHCDVGHTVVFSVIRHSALNTNRYGLSRDNFCLLPDDGSLCTWAKTRSTLKTNIRKRLRLAVVFPIPASDLQPVVTQTSIKENKM